MRTVLGLLTLCALLGTTSLHAQQRTAFPVVDAATQKDRDNTRKHILLDELQTEKNKAEEIQSQLQRAKETHQSPSEILKLENDQHRYEANILALNKEINAVSGQPAKNTAFTLTKTAPTNNRPIHLSAHQKSQRPMTSAVCRNGWDCHSAEGRTIPVASNQYSQCKNGWRCTGNNADNMTDIK